MYSPRAHVPICKEKYLLDFVFSPKGLVTFCHDVLLHHHERSTSRSKSHDDTLQHWLFLFRRKVFLFWYPHIMFMFAKMKSISVIRFNLIMRVV